MQFICINHNKMREADTKAPQFYIPWSALPEISSISSYCKHWESLPNNIQIMILLLYIINSYPFNNTSTFRSSNLT